MKKLTDYFRRQVKLIEDDWALRTYGAILCLTHIVSAIHWGSRSFTREEVFCFPFFSQCRQVSEFLLSDYKMTYLGTYTFMALASAIFFLLKKGNLGYFAFFVASIMKYVFHIGDYRNMGNYHYMAHVLYLVFLFADNKKALLRIFLLLFYLSAGILKFNSDWLSGGVIAVPFFFHGKILEWAMVYVIILELIFSWFLLSRHKVLRYFTLIQLYLFHLVSYWVVGYFYPVLMCLFLLIFPLTDKEVSSEKKIKPNAFEWTVVGIFVVAQLVPLLFFSHSGLNGTGRLISLNMFDVRSVCETSMFLKYKDKIIEYNPNFDFLRYRIQCDPSVVLDHIKRTCEDQKRSNTFVDIDVNHQVRMFSKDEVPVSLTFSNVCSRPLDINIFGYIRQE